MIYAIRQGDDGPVKIGFTRDTETLLKRISSLQTANPYKLKLMNVFEGDNTHENEIHNIFCEYRLEGEWFICSEPVLEFAAKGLMQDRRTDALNNLKVTRKLDVRPSPSFCSVCAEREKYTIEIEKCNSNLLRKLDIIEAEAETDAVKKIRWMERKIHNLEKRLEAVTLKERAKSMDRRLSMVK